MKSTKGSDITKTFITPKQKLQKGSILGGRYTIIEELGRGGMGVVYKAEDTKLKRLVALKFLPQGLTHVPEIKSRFIREAQAAAALDHPNICTVHEFDETEETAFISMAYIEGQSLKKKIESGPLDMEETLNIATQVAEGLQEAHKKGIVHRDIKSGNIMVTDRGQAKIMDFGLARTAEQTLLTKEGSTMGTIAYMSPEQAKGEPVDQRTDIWSFGVVLYEMLTGQIPFKGDHDQAMVYSIRKDKPEPVTDARPEVPKSIEQVIDKALEKNPDKRYQQIDDLLDDLKSISAGIVPEEIKARLRKARLRKRKKSFLYAGAATLVMAAVFIAFLLLTGPAEAIDSIAVLPLENLTGDTEMQYFVDGVTDELIGQLGQISGLKRVISRTSVMRYKNTDKSLPEIARELNVDALVEGTVYQVGENVSVKLQLFDALPDERSLWTERYDRPVTEVLMMYGEMAAAITENIEVKLTADETTRFADARRVNPEAYDAYLKGLFHWQRLNPEDLEAALQYFDSALENDPNYIPALTGMCLVGGGYSILGVMPPDEAAAKVTAAREKVLGLEDKPAEIHYLLATERTWGEMDWEKAEESYRKAIELNPNYPDVRAYYSHYLFIMHRPDEAMFQIERAMELDPFNPLFQSLYGADLMFMRRYDEAIIQFQKALKTVPNHGVAADMLAVAYFQKGMYKEAVEQKKGYYESIGLEEVAKALTLGYEKAGCREAWISAAETLENLSKETLILPSYISESYSYAGEKEKALDWLEKGWESGIDANNTYIGVMPHYVDLLGDEPRFQELLRKMNLPVGKLEQ
ncbi:MAG: protein kinase [Candidatus Aminicenantes bacterium]|nr:protein kinase [Candidatus Aminicenantes bacterium]